MAEIAELAVSERAEEIVPIVDRTLAAAGTRVRCVRRSLYDPGVRMSVTRRAGVASLPSGERQPVDLLLVHDYDGDVTRGPRFSRGTSPIAGVPGDAALALSCRSPRQTEWLLRSVLSLGRQRITVVHKGNALKCTDGVLHNAAVALGIETIIVDHMCAELVRDPGGYDVLVAPALYADIMDAVVSGLLPPAPVAAIGYGQAGPARFAGRPDPRPAVAVLSTLRAAGCLLRHQGEHAVGDRLDRAIDTVADRADLVDLNAHAVERLVTEALVASGRLPTTSA